jgi:hypothetical protein
MVALLDLKGDSLAQLLDRGMGKIARLATLESSTA